MTSRPIADTRNVVSSPCSSQMMYFAVPTRPAARPPNACDSAVRCGTAVSATRDSGMPGAACRPPARAAIHLYSTISGASSVPTIAAVMPPTPAATPRRAVRGWFSHRSERMKRTAATK